MRRLRSVPDLTEGNMNPFNNWSDADVAQFNARRQPAEAAPADAVADESDLHEQVRAECARHGWVCLMGRMDKRTGRNVGELDCTVVTDHGEVYFAELKAKGGKLTTEQRGMIAWLVKLGANARVIYSINEFREFTK